MTLKRILLIAVLAFTVLIGKAWPTEQDRLAQMALVKERLNQSTTTDDSIKNLFDLFDICLNENKKKVGWELLRVAKHSKNFDVITAIVPQLAVLEVGDAKALDRLYQLTETIPDCEGKKAAQLFVRVQKVFNEADYLPENERNEALRKYAQEDLTPKNDIYEDVFDLYRVIVFIRHNVKGNLYTEYLLRLEELISQLPKENRWLVNQLYTTAANHYTAKGFRDKAIAVDKKLLEKIRNLEEDYKKKGRKYRNYDRFYYICYRRMLSNYEALTLPEVKDLYAKCALLAEKDHEIAADFNNGRPSAYRLMAEKDYAAAIPYIKKGIDSKVNKDVELKLVTMLIEASDSIDDSASLLDGLRKYNALMKDVTARAAETMATELQMRYDVNTLKAEKAKLEIEHKDLEISTTQKIITITLGALFLLVLGLMFLYRSHFRLLRKTRDLEEANKKLRQNIELMFDDGTPSGSSNLYTTPAPQDKSE